MNAPPRAISFESARKTPASVLTRGETGFHLFKIPMVRNIISGSGTRRRYLGERVDGVINRVVISLADLSNDRERFPILRQPRAEPV